MFPDPQSCNVTGPMPKSLKIDEPEMWSMHGLESALLITGMNVFEPRANSWVFVKLDEKKMWKKVSLFIQALDLAKFDDYDIFLDDDLEAVRQRQLSLCHPSLKCNIL